MNLKIVITATVDNSQDEDYYLEQFKEYLDDILYDETDLRNVKIEVTQEK